MPLLLMSAKYQIQRKYCAPNIFARFVCAMLSFRVHTFPAKYETQKTGKIIMEYITYCTI